MKTQPYMHPCVVYGRHRFRYFIIWPDEDDSEADAVLKHTSTILLRAPREYKKEILIYLYDEVWKAP